ncbi:glycosyltransferase family 61 protein [Acidimicrobiaceae bacterium]|nr:glycosyltransferase family 61 protein [Acidimicrobiaceae bacterium]
MLKRNLIFKEYISNRNLPRNYKESDIILFGHELRKIIPKSYTFSRKNIFTKGQNLFNSRGNEILTDCSRMSKQSIKNKVRLFYRNRENINSYKLVEKSSWIMDEKSRKFFHWMTDNLSRIGLLLKQNIDDPIIIDQDTYNCSFVKESIELLKVNFIVTPSEKFYKHKEITITSKTAPSGNYNKELLNFISYKLKQSVTDLPVSNIKKIWISRSQTNHRKIKNENEIREIIEDYGFQIVYPEQNNLKENIRLFNNAEWVAGLHGAGLTNMMFMERNNNILEIRRKNDDNNNCYFTMASDLEQNYFYLDAESLNENFYLSDCILDPKELKQFFKRYL